MSTGVAQRDTAGGGYANVANNWVQSLASGDSPSNYEIRFTLTASNGVGDDNVTTGVWLALSATRTCELSYSGADGNAGTRTYTVEIRRNSTVVTSCTLTMLAQALEL